MEPIETYVLFFERANGSGFANAVGSEEGAVDRFISCTGKAQRDGTVWPLRSILLVRSDGTTQHCEIAVIDGRLGVRKLGFGCS